ncbi:MAG: ABC transporter substrate-binding protein [Clostridia bacterium]|nr:ABC transporter substrate-binding protein [Clostridia bacterium]
MKKILSLVLAVLMIAGCCAALSSCGKSNTIKIGMSGPLTGDAAVYGKAVQNSADMAIKEINDNGGLNGIMLELLPYDDQAKSENVQTNYASMIEAGVQVSLGCVTTGAGMEFTALSKDDNLFFLTPSATGDEIPQNPNGYQMCFADSNQGGEAAKYVNSLNLSHIGILYRSDDAYSTGILKQFKENLNSNITYTEASFTTNQPTDLSAQIDLLKDCTFIFCPIYYTPAATFMLQAKDKIAKDAVYYGCDGFDGIESAEGFDISTIPQKISMLSHFDSKATEGLAGDYVKKYTETYGKDTLNQFGASAYDCVYAIFGAMKKAVEAGKEITAETSAYELCEILKEQFNGDYTFSGVTGTNVTWQSSGYVTKEAKYVVIKEVNAN